jgi:putative ABC transport system substrate-binding protein
MTSRRRRAVVATGIGSLQWLGWRTASAQHKVDPRRLGVLLVGRAENWDFLRRDLIPALARFGWVEGRNLSIDWRVVERAEALPIAARALINSDVSAILTRGSPATRELQRATSTLPIVTGVGDPVGSGFAASLASPGGNITGVSYAGVETTIKRLELLRELAPGIEEVLLIVPATLARQGDNSDYLTVLMRGVRQHDVRHQVFSVESVADLQAALGTVRRLRRCGVLVSAVGTIEPATLAQVWLRDRVPTTFDQRAYVELGGMMSYLLNWEDQVGRTAQQLDKVLRGTAPAQIPFELPTLSELVINARTVRAIGLALPTALRIRANEVIE